jgi:hypothetical protein
MDPQKQISDAAVFAEDGKTLRGYHLIGPDGQLVLGRPGCVYLQADGVKVVVGGLKKGWKLGTDADYKAKKAAGEAADKAETAAKHSDAAKGIKQEAIPSK